MLVAAFVVRERRCRAPMVDLSLFRRMRFTAGVSSGLLAFLVLFGVLVVVPFYLERATGFGTVRTGLELMVMPVALGLVAPFSGRMADRSGVRLPAVDRHGAGDLAAGLVGLRHCVRPPWGFLALLVVVGAGLGLFISPNNAGIMASVPAEQSGPGIGAAQHEPGTGDGDGAGRGQGGVRRPRW